MDVMNMDPAMLIAAGVVGLGLLGLVFEMLMGRRAGAGSSSRSPIQLVSEPRAATVAPAAEATPAPVAEPVAAAPIAQPVSQALPPGPISHAPQPAPQPAPQAAPHPMQFAQPTSVLAPVAVASFAAPVRDPLAEHRRFFSALGAALSANDEAPPASLSALHANLTADVFMERMTLAARGWRPDGFATGARDLLLRADGTPPDVVAAKVLEGYEQLKLGHVKEALDAFLGGIEAAKIAAQENPGNPWPHAWSAFAWRGLALIAEEAGDVQATLAGLKVAYQSMVNAFEVTMQGVPEKLSRAA